jgi:hypothetical protein
MFHAVIFCVSVWLMACTRMECLNLSPLQSTFLLRSFVRVYLILSLCVSVWHMTLSSTECLSLSLLLNMVIFMFIGISWCHVLCRCVSWWTKLSSKNCQAWNACAVCYSYHTFAHKYTYIHTYTHTYSYTCTVWRRFLQVCDSRV